MITFTRSDPCLTFWIQISKVLCLRIALVSMKVWYHIMVDMGPSSLLEESSYNLGLNFSAYARRMGTFFMMMMMMMMMNCFCGMVDRRKALSLIFSRDHCQRSSPSRISDTPRGQVAGTSCGTILWKRYQFDRNRIRARFWCCPWYDWEMWSNWRVYSVYSGNGQLFHYVTTSW